MSCKADILIRGGTFFSMLEEEPQVASLAIKEGRILAILPPEDEIDAGYVYDASGLFVTPGFVDSHMHDEYFKDADTVQHALIRQGVTTAIAGHCGSGPMFDVALAERPRPWLHLGYMVGNCTLREAVGRTDRYSSSSDEEIVKMCMLLRKSLGNGAMGLSLGLEYAPGASYSEINALVSVVAEFPSAVLTVHIRYDDIRDVASIQEAISYARNHGIRLQISHLGSVTMGRTKECLSIIDSARQEGLDIGFDCYPYYVFCAKAASAVFDEVFVQRWGIMRPEDLEAVSGRFKGQRMTFETLAIMRETEPMDLVIAHVMNREEVDACITHPECLIVSDALFTGDGAHPRIAGAFPKALGIMRENGYDWRNALGKMTVDAADRLRINAGRLAVGSVADVIVFDPDNFTDRATFQHPFLSPGGLYLVIINGKVVLNKEELSDVPYGDIIRRGHLC